MPAGKRPVQPWSHQGQEEGLRDPCPSWCIIPREPGDTSDEHVHTAARRGVAWVELRRGPSPDENDTSERRAEAITYDIVRYRYSGDYEDWVYIGDDVHGLDLSLESARRVAIVVLEYLDGMDT